MNTVQHTVTQVFPVRQKPPQGGVENKYCGHIHSRRFQAAMKSTKKEEKRNAKL